MGSLAGENSKSKLHIVDVTTVRSSFDGDPVRRAINGFQTEWSWKIIINLISVINK